LIIQDGELNKYTIDTSGRVLDKNVLDGVLKSIVNPTDTIPKDNQTFYVFNPHHGIVFYSKDKKRIAHISICYISGRICFYPPNKDYIKGYALFENVFSDVGYPVFYRPEYYCGYARRFKSEIDTTERVLRIDSVDVKPFFQIDKLTYNDYLQEYFFCTISDSSYYDKKISYSFIIEKNGEVTFQKIINKKNTLEEKRLLISLYGMPNWVPGKKNGQNERILIEKTIYLKEE
jgi:hypothetical protein